MKQTIKPEPNVLREIGKIIAGSFYEHQEVRIAENNRVRDIK